MPAVAVTTPSVAVVSGPSFCGISDMVPEVRALLEDRPLRTFLTTAPTGGSGQSAVATDIVWARGNVMEFDDGGEHARVTNDPAGTTTLTLERGIDDTTAASHADGVAVLKDFKFAYTQITRALENTISQMSPWAYATNTQDITPVSGTYIYELNGDFLDLIDVVQEPNATTVTRMVRYGKGQELPVYIERELITSLSSTTLGLRFPVFDNFTNVVHVTYVGKLTDTTVECGLMADTVVLGACYRLVKGKSTPRVVAQDTTQGDVSVTPLARAQVARDFYADFQIGCARIRADLDARHRREPKYTGKGR